MKYILLSIISILALTVTAQINKPALSPGITLAQSVGLANVDLVYGQPSALGRKIFGELIPFEKVWRTGANSSTKITFDRDVKLAGNKVAAGKYGLYTIPDKDKWTIILSTNSGRWGSAGYDLAEDHVRFDVPVTNLSDYVESLNIHFAGFNYDGGNLLIEWENTRIVIPVFVDSKSILYAEIDQKITNAKGDISAQTYFDAAQYYYHTDKDLPTAAKWFDKAIELKPAAFWFVYYRAELANYTGDLKTANKLVNQSLQAATESPSGDYGYIAKCTILKDQIAKSKK